eukprot:COSAG01_NODE_70219_length_259_cov_0.650000_1_plen_20_part_01
MHVTILSINSTVNMIMQAAS